MNEEKILKKLEGHDKQFDIVIKKLEQHDQKFAQHDKQFDIVIGKLVEHDAKIDTLATKDDLSALREEMISGQDAMMTVLKRLDEERVYAHERLNKVVEKVEEHTKDIRQIKAQLKMA
ncbi:MAG: hypothetical protein HY983_00095 [Candidatus Magasanikbacteria bacterium]|nr:hypothetical protein [Candidatus Magasanikbacteria bacterium]